MIWHSTKIHERFKLCLEKSFTRKALPLTISLRKNLQIWRNQPLQSYARSSTPVLKVFLFLQIFWCTAFWSYFCLQIWAALSIYYFVCVHAFTTLCTSIALPSTIIVLIQSHHLLHSRFVHRRLPMHAKIGAQSFSIWWQFHGQYF